ncbi:putative reverse transcriptase [Senna tora]|uniref:Putative reverse transcriptase n=1 Tax=Senna tora TaxID=362788 RepID=A0A834SZU2_9FABA|nr:putative reverse transcriptase [Senna tora]
MGKGSSLLVEVWAVYLGLSLAWEKKLTNIDLEVDSAMIVRLIKSDVDMSHPLFSLISDIRSMISNNWDVMVRHVYREGNRMADRLANFAQGLNACQKRLVESKITAGNSDNQDRPRVHHSPHPTESTAEISYTIELGDTR